MLTVEDFVKYYNFTRTQEYKGICNAVLDQMSRDNLFGNRAQRRKAYFFLSTISESEKFVISPYKRDGSLAFSIVYQQRVDGTVNGVPFNVITAIMKTVLERKFNVKLSKADISNFILNGIRLYEYAVVPQCDFDIKEYSKEAKLAKQNEPV